jgi:hypothetical protein
VPDELPLPKEIGHEEVAIGLFTITQFEIVKLVVGSNAVEGGSIMPVSVEVTVIHEDSSPH